MSTYATVSSYLSPPWVRHLLFGTTKKSELDITGQYLYTALGPALFAIVGTTLTYFVHSGWTPIDAFYWTVVTMTTIGYGDLLPDHWSEKVFTTLFMPVATAALAATIREFSDIRRRRELARAKLAFVADKVLLAGRMPSVGSESPRSPMGPTASDSINEDQFIISVLLEEGLVDTRLVDTMRQKFRGLLEDHNMCFPERDRKLQMDTELVYFHLKQQGRVVDVSRPKVANEKRVVRVDMASGRTGQRLPGYHEWLRDHWTDQGNSAATLIQRVARGQRMRTKFKMAIEMSSLTRYHNMVSDPSNPDLQA